jgi:hypothetical protein
MLVSSLVAAAFLAQAEPATAPSTPALPSPTPPTTAMPVDTKPLLAPTAPRSAPVVTVTPYGFIHAALYDNLSPFAARDYPGQVGPQSEGGSFLFSPRASRFGFKVGLGDTVWGPLRDRPGRRLHREGRR